MAKAIGSSDSLARVRSIDQPLRLLYRLRLGLGLGVLLGSTLFLLGGSWDIEWHTVIGRDRTLIPPHLMMLAGIAVSGIAALLAVLIETFLARRSAEIAENTTSFAGIFYAPLGAYLAGFSALSAGIGFVLDSYWHALYGIDVAIWAPFHIMLIGGSGMTSLGAVYILASSAHLAERVGSASRAVLTSYIGIVIAFTMLLGIVAILLLDGYGRLAYILIGPSGFSVFPLMAASLSMWILLMAVKVLPWRWSASYIMIGYLLLAGIIILFVPPAIRGLAQAEQLNFRRAQEVLPQVARAWPIGVVYSAIALDILRHRAQRKAWSTRKFTLLTALITLPGFLPIALAIPYIFVGIFLTVGALGFILSVLLGLGGSFVGIWFGERTGESLLEQESGVVQERVVA
jgi:hypothetical protein